MKTFIYLCVILFTIILAVNATPTISSNENSIPVVNRNQLEEGFMRKLKMKCNQRDNNSCLMLKLNVYMNRIFKKSTIDINDYIRVTENRHMEEIADDPEDDLLLARSINSDDETLGLLVANKIWKFIRSRTLRYKFTDNADFVVTTEPKGNLNLGVSISPNVALEEGRGRLRHIIPLLLVMTTKAGVIGALILKGLFLLAGKALIVSKIALLLSVIIALKKLMSQKKHVVEIPHHDSYNSGWARALDGFLEGVAEMPAQLSEQDAHEMAFTAQKPT